MSDSSQGHGWWQASDGKWYPPDQHPDAAPPPPGSIPAAPAVPQTSGGSGCLKWGLVALGVLVGLGLLAVGCVAVVGNEVADDIGEAVDEALGEADPSDYDLELTDCEADGDFGTTTATGTITNRSDKAQGFEIEVRFETSSGDLIERNSTFVDRLEIDQSTEWEVSAFGTRAGEPGVTCEVDEVSYSIFDDE